MMMQVDGSVNMFVSSILMLGLLVLGFVLIASYRKKDLRWWVLRGVAVLAILFLFLAPVLHYMRMGRSVESATRLVGTPSESAIAVTDSSGGDVADLSAFPADVYPSRDLAVEALAGQLADAVAATADRHENELPFVRVQGQAPPAVLERVGAIMRQRAQTRMVLVKVPGGRPPGEVLATDLHCSVRIDDDEGEVQMALSGPSGQAVRAARFVDKPWAANFARFDSESEHRHLLARSERPCTSFAEASTAARESAAAQLLPAVRQAIDRRPGQGRHRSDCVHRDHELLPIVLEQLRQGVAIVDRFPQQYERAYGDLWRQSLLVDASAETMQTLADNVHAQLLVQRDIEQAHRRVQVESWAGIIGPIVGLAVLILAVYALLNAVTKGYYTGVLRAGAVVALGVAVGVAVALMMLLA